ncbi:hypothetical protein [Salinibaculum rarum]|uniref:hypothetical protein n=1 Tax=Salinibaculum rarum TaxID=3058903 RepID=UPI00265DDBA4|nr:hypothetical protein [Salinibaculum sp. KK48]
MSSSPNYTAPVARNTEPKQELSQLTFNHPKNYVGVPLAVTADADTGYLINNRLVSMCGRARDGAEALGLIDCDANLTSIGRKFVSNCTETHSAKELLTLFASLKGSSERFIDAIPEPCATATTVAVSNYNRTQEIIDLLEKTGPITLPQLLDFALQHDYTIGDEFIRESSDIDTTNPQHHQLTHPENYSGQAVYQFKTLLYHSGILTERGSDTTALVPQQDLWELEPPFKPTQRLGGEL